MSRLFLLFSGLRIAQRGGARDLPVLHTMGSIGVPKVKKIIFSTFVRTPLRMLKEAFLAAFEHVVRLFGAWKVPKCLGMGRFVVSDGSKLCFSKCGRGPFGVHKHVKGPRCEPFWPFQGPKKRLKYVSF